ncbi:MAG TPA: DUF3857 domain-containing protein [Candidatus Omnitrophica bacterium]|nr:DUF3857 domain-containing protein [Candidatus Omnitrophota bacterium]
MSLGLLLRIVFFVFIIFSLSCTSSLDNFYQAYQKTVSRYQSLLDRNPQDSELRLRLAKFYYHFKEYEKVVKLLEKEKSLLARSLYAKALTRLHDYSKALEVFNQIKEKITSPEALYLYGLVLEKKNLYSQAVEVYQKVTPPFQKLAQKHLENIKAKVEGELPPYVKEIVSQSQQFLQQIQEEAGVILLVDESIEITSTNTSFTTLHVIEKVLKERGKKLAEVEIGYDSTYERVELEFARTITPQGKLIYAGRENIRDVTKYLNYPLYSNARAFIISLPGVEVDSLIEYKIKIYSSKLINGDDFSFFYRLKEKYPIYKANFRLVLPKHREAKFKILNKEYAKDVVLEPQVREDEGHKIYWWHFEKISPIIPERKMPPFSLVNPTILISSFQDWEEIYNWWCSLYKDKLTLSKEMKELVATLIRGANSGYEKAKRLYEYVAKNIRYVAVEYGESGYEPHQAQEVFLNRYGDCKDQAILLVALLREAGLESFPVLIPTQEAYSLQKDFPSLVFNHAICAVNLGGELIFMDPTSQTTAFGDLPLSDQNREVLLFSSQGFKIVKTPLLKNTHILYCMEITIDEKENAFIKREVTSRGCYASYQRYYLKYTHPQRIREDIKKRITEISPFAKLLDYHIENVEDFSKFPKLIYTFTAEKFLKPAKNLRIIPALNEIDLSHSLIAKERRNFPIDFRGVFTRQAKVAVKLPSNLRVKYLPNTINLTTEWFDFQLDYTYHPQKHKLEFLQKFVLKKRFVNLEDYALFREKLKNVFYVLKSEVILEKKD